jgi:hypothetical protein
MQIYEGRENMNFRYDGVSVFRQIMIYGLISSKDLCKKEANRTVLLPIKP